MSRMAGQSGKSSWFRWPLVVLAGALLLWAGTDLYGPRRADIRDFDPGEVARLDTAMWRSYYDRKPLEMFFQLAELMRRQFHFPLLRSYVAAASAAKAAFVFKDGHDRGDYERALPDLVRYYEAIRKISLTPFDARRAARSELEWWIVHRERARHRDGDLERALAEAASEIYLVPVETLVEYGRFRAEAMTLRDSRASAGGVGERDWRRIEDALRISWKSLGRAVSGPDTSRAIRRT
jgi:hypothetical protein